MATPIPALVLAALFLPALATVAAAADPDAINAGQRASSMPDASVMRRGTDEFIGKGGAPAGPIPGGPVNLNLVDAPVALVAKAVLADTFGWSYTLDERVTGTVTLQTGGLVRRERLLAMFEQSLSSRGAVMRRRGNDVQIVAAGGPPGVRPVQSIPDLAGEPGARALAVPLRWISAAEMQGILASVAPRDVVLRADRTRNLLILSGDRAQIEALRETIAVFDVDWMRGMSTAVVPVRSSNPAAITRSLVEIFGVESAGPGAVIRFIPNEPLNAVLVVTSRAAYLDRARDWIAKLEGMASDRERQLFVYRIQNRSAKELAAVLQGVVAAETGATAGGVGAGMSAGMSAGMGYGGGYGAGGTDAAGASLGFGAGGGAGTGLGGGPGGGGAAFNGGASGGGLSGGDPSGGGFGGANSYGQGGGIGPYGQGAPYGQTAAQGGGIGPAVYGGGAGLGAGYGAVGLGAGGYGGIDPTGMSTGGQRREGGVGIVADESNNSLVISATRTQYDKILKVLGRLDAMPTQVLLETVIAEVTLNDELEFGVQWFLKNGRSGFNLAQGATVAAAATTGGTAGLIASAARGVPGFNYLLNGTDFNVVLNALRGVTRVNVISSPSITVLDNRTAKLQVGDQVPIVRQTGQSALAAGAPILNQIELKDTGVILAVTPRVNKNGLVVLDINQEVSDVVPTTTSTIDSPTIRQRRVATSVAVKDGHNLAIGGLVQEKAQITNESLPILGDLPILGPAFRNRSDVRVRTELIIFIRPRVIRGTAEADSIASEFRDQFKAMMPVRPVPAPPPLEALHDGGVGLRQRMLD